MARTEAIMPVFCMRSSLLSSLGNTLYSNDSLDDTENELKTVHLYALFFRPTSDSSVVATPKVIKEEPAAAPSMSQIEDMTILEAPEVVYVDNTSPLISPTSAAVNEVIVVETVPDETSQTSTASYY